MVDLINSRLFTNLSGFYPDTCEIQTPVESQDDYGQTQNAWPALSGHSSIPCRRSPTSGQERKMNNQIYSVATHVINLTGSYPTITPKMRAVISGVAYDILLVELDGQDFSTRLIVQVVS